MIHWMMQTYGNGVLPTCCNNTVTPCMFAFAWGDLNLHRCIVGSRAWHISGHINSRGLVSLRRERQRVSAYASSCAEEVMYGPVREMMKMSKMIGHSRGFAYWNSVTYE